MRRAWYAVGVLMLLYVCSFADRQILSLLVAPIKRDFGMSNTQIGLLQGLAFAILYTTLGLPLGWLADRMSRRRIIAFGVFFWSLAATACGMAANATQLFLARVGVGVGEATLSPSAYSLITDYFKPEKLGRAFGIYNMGITIGSGVALIAGGLVVSWVSTAGESFTLPIVGTVRAWQMVFIVTGAPGLLLCLLMFTVPEPPRRGQGGPRRPRRVAACARDAALVHRTHPPSSPSHPFRKDHAMTTALITGSNRGLGLEFCRQFLAAGSNVIATCRNPDEAANLRTLRNRAGKVDIHQLDSVKPRFDLSTGGEAERTPDRLSDQQRSHFRKQDRFATELDETQWLDVFRTNTMGPTISRELCRFRCRERAARHGVHLDPAGDHQGQRQRPLLYVSVFQIGTERLHQKPVDRLRGQRRRVHRGPSGFRAHRHGRSRRRDRRRHQRHRTDEDLLERWIRRITGCSTNTLASTCPGNWAPVCERSESKPAHGRHYRSGRGTRPVAPCAVATALTEIIAVRRADHGVDVGPRRLRIDQRHAGLMVEFDQDRRAVDAIIEHAVVVVATDPGKIRLVQIGRSTSSSLAGGIALP